MVEHLLLLGGHVNCDIRRSESRAFNKAKIAITDTTTKIRWFGPSPIKYIAEKQQGY
jgi:hypothetical protein